MGDVNKYKAEVAAAFVNKRCPGVNITHSIKPCQDYDEEFYRQFQVIIGGLDNIEARRFLNNMCHRLVEWEGDEPQVGTFFIDGGTEGFQGQARLIHPFKTACYECTLDQLPPDENSYPMCTVKETPRLPEHCIQYVMMIEWEKNFDRKMDKDNPDDMNWVFEKAKERADEYGIKGVTYKLTMGVTKNIIPAVASTNAIVSAACVNETIKVLTGCA